MYHHKELGIPGLLVSIALTTATHTSFANNSEPLFNGVENLSSDDLVEAVLARHPDPMAAKATWQASLAHIDQLATWEDPMISYTVAPRTLTGSDSDTSYMLSVSQQIPWPGKLKAGTEALRYEANADQYDIEEIQRGLIKLARQGLADWYFIHAAIRVNEINQSLLKEFRESAGIKYVSGRTSKQEVLQVDVELALLEHRGIVLERQRQEIQTMLNTLLQRQPDLPVPLPADLSIQSRIPAIEELRNIALAARPELLAISSRINAYRERARLTKLESVPDISVTAGYDHFWDDADQHFTVGMEINIPLQKKRKASVTEAHEILNQLIFNHRSLTSQVVREVQQAHDRLRENEHVLGLYREKLIPLAEESLTTARSEYEAGSGDFLDLITAERNLITARLNTEEAITDYHRNLAELEWAIAESTVLGYNRIQGVRHE